MAWVELLESHAGDMDRFDSGKVTRRFRVWGGVAIATILTAPETVSNDAGQFLPARGSAHPDYIDGSMVLQSYSCATDSTTVIATANYDNGGEGSITDPDKRIGTSFERRNVKMLFAAKKKLDIFKGEPPVIRWDVRENPIIENFLRLTYRVIVPKKDPYGQEPGWDGVAIERIRAAIGEIHRFGFDGAAPSSWQFSGADVADRNKGEAVTVTYSWIRDPGTEVYYFEHPAQDPDAYFLWPQRDKPDGYGNLFVRPPFTTLSWGLDLETNLPVWFVVQTSVRNDEGWHGLPGLFP